MNDSPWLGAGENVPPCQLLKFNCCVRILLAPRCKVRYFLCHYRGCAQTNPLVPQVSSNTLMDDRFLYSLAVHRPWPLSETWPLVPCLVITT